jgi:hypothetical protein
LHGPLLPLAKRFSGRLIVPLFLAKDFEVLIFCFFFIKEKEEPNLLIKGSV